LAVAAANALWDCESSLATAARVLQFVREAGVLAELPIHLSALAIETARIGEFAAAASLIAQIDSVIAATGSRFIPGAALRLYALQGAEAESAALIADIVEQDSAGTLALWAHWAAAVLYNGLSRYHEAMAAARQATSSTREVFVTAWALPELVEAAARVGDAGSAREALERLAETTQAYGTDFGLGIEARCRALVADGDDADLLHGEAIERLSRTRLRPELARSHLVYGEWLRREGRRIDARKQLRIAHEMLTAIGMKAYAERARRELVATGAKARKRDDDTREQLTPQENLIARLARDGATNPEISAQLFLSTRTVEWHLHKIFAKLDIDSRRELTAALAQPELTDPPA
jgi:DNA-binding CsgD family transcriptional regulator